MDDGMIQDRRSPISAPSCRSPIRPRSAWSTRASGWRWRWARASLDLTENSGWVRATPDITGGGLMRALLIDDERLARAELRRLLAAHPEVEIVGEAVNAADGVQQIAALKPDLMLPRRANAGRQRLRYAGRRWRRRRK
jgi:hypothetical protein